MVLRIGTGVSVLAGTVLVFASAAAAASSAYAVTELPVASNVLGIAADPATNTVYAGVGDPAASIGIAVIDGATNTVTAQIGLSLPPAAIAVDPVTDTVYAVSVEGGAAWVINGATNAVATSTIALAPGEPLAAAVNSVTNMIYVTDNQGTVTAISGSTDTAAAVINLKDPVLDPTPAPDGVGVDTATNTVYVADGSQVDVIDGATNTVTGRIALPAGSAADGLVVDSAAGQVYVADQGTGAISVIDTATDAVSTLTQGLSDPEGLALDAGTGTLYATTPGSGASTDLGTTYAIDFSTGAIADQVPRGGTSAGLAASGGSVYVDGSTALQLLGDVTVMTPSTVSTMSPVMFVPCCTTFVVGQPGQVQLTASATPAATYSSTDLPSWLSLSPSGLLSGTPPAGSEGLYAPLVTASNGVAPPSSEGVGFDVADLAITSADQAVFGVGDPGSFIVTAGFLTPTFSETGELPAGVTLSSAGVLSGTPASAGTYSITITATGSVGTATQVFTLFVDVPGAPPAAGGVLGDVTGDGLADILAVDSAGKLWLYPNTGSGDANMFTDGRSQVGSGWSGYALAAVAPLYGSARAGLLAIAPGGNLWYYPNTGGTGLGTFGGRSQVGTGWTGYTVVGLTDLYSTGQPGILAIDPSGNLWYYPNAGGSGLGTFGARSQVGSGWTGYTVDVGDFIGNARPDLIAVDPAGNIWYYPNTVGGTGTNTWSEPTQIGTGWAGYQAIDVGALTSAGGDEQILGIDPAGGLWYYPNEGGSPIQDLLGTPIQVGTGWTGYRIN